MEKEQANTPKKAVALEMPIEDTDRDNSDHFIELLTKKPWELDNMTLRELQQQITIEQLDEYIDKQIVEVTEEVYRDIGQQYEHRKQRAMRDEDSNDYYINEVIAQAISDDQKNLRKLKRITMRNKNKAAKATLLFREAIHGGVVKQFDYIGSSPAPKFGIKSQPQYVVSYISTRDMLQTIANEKFAIKQQNATDHKEKSYYKLREFGRHIAGRELARKFNDLLDRSDIKEVREILELIRAAEGRENIDEIFVSDFRLHKDIMSLKAIDESITQNRQPVVEPQDDPEFQDIVAYEKLGFELLPTDRLEPSEEDEIEEKDDESIARHIPDVEPIRRKIIEALLTQWSQQGFKITTYLSPFAENEDAFKDYIVLTRRNEDEASEDVVAISKQYGHATYLLRGDEFNWRHMFKLTKKEFKNWIEDYAVGAVLINNSEPEMATQSISQYLDSRKVADDFPRYTTTQRIGSIAIV